ncbi:MAG TPA: histidine phosphatase family protein [Mycobacteriales bacterium]|nr:histidine phosphatase family protein [Mycobacteriales bacterium]
MTRTVVHLLRHGEVDNPNKIMYGRLPGFHLSANGRRMAERAAKSLLDRDITYLVSSPLERARETAEPLASALDLPVRIDDRLIEADNSFQGVRVGNGPRFLLDPRCWPRLRNPARPSWGEPYLVLAARMWAATTAARDAASGHEAVCVSHQLPIWTLRRYVEGGRLWHDPRKRHCALASLTSFTFDGERVIEIAYTEPAGGDPPDTVPGA